MYTNRKAITVFEDYDKAFEEGISIGEHHFDVHRYVFSLCFLLKDASC